MNWDQIEGKWKDIKGQVRQKWAKLTDDDYESIAGKKDRFVGKLQERYGYEKDRADQEINSFLTDFDKKPSRH